MSVFTVISLVIATVFAVLTAYERGKRDGILWSMEQYKNEHDRTCSKEYDDNRTIRLVQQRESRGGSVKADT